MTTIKKTALALSVIVLFASKSFATATTDTATAVNYVTVAEGPLDVKYLLRVICELLGDALGVAPAFTDSGAAGPAYVADDHRMNALLGSSNAHFAQYLHTILT